MRTRIISPMLCIALSLCSGCDANEGDPDGAPEPTTPRSTKPARQFADQILRAIRTNDPDTEMTLLPPLEWLKKTNRNQDDARRNLKSRIESIREAFAKAKVDLNRTRVHAIYADEMMSIPGAKQSELEHSHGESKTTGWNYADNFLILLENGDRYYFLRVDNPILMGGKWRVDTSSPEEQIQLAASPDGAPMLISSDVLTRMENESDFDEHTGIRVCK